MSAPNPYAPPSVPAAPALPPHAPAYPTSFRAEGPDAFIAIGAHLPDVCLKCNAEQGLLRRNLPLENHPFWLYGLIGLGGLPYFLFRSGIARGWASLCLCGRCMGRYQNAHLARWSVAPAVVMWIFVVAGLRHAVTKPEAVTGEFVVGEIFFFILFLGATFLAWLVFQFFVAPRVLRLEQVQAGVMRVTGIDRDALDVCARYAAYWDRARALQANPWGHNAAYGTHNAAYGTWVPAAGHYAATPGAPPQNAYPPAVPQEGPGSSQQPSSGSSQEPPAAPNLEPAPPNHEPAAPNLDAAAPNLEPAAPNLEPAPPNLEPAAPNLDAAAPNLEPAPPNLEPAAPQPKLEG